MATDKEINEIYAMSSDYLTEVGYAKSAHEIVSKAIEVLKGDNRFEELYKTCEDSLGDPYEEDVAVEDLSGFLGEYLD